MDPRMMLAGINRRYEYVGDYRYTHRCTRVTCSCYFDVSSMESFISCQSSKNCPRSTLLAEKNCASMIRLDYIPCADPGFLFREKEELMEEGYPSLPRGGRSEVYFTNQIKEFAFSRVIHLLDPRIHAIFYIILYNLFIGIYIIIHSLDI